MSRKVRKIETYYTGAIFPTLLLEQILELFLPFTNMFLFLGRVESNLAVAAPNLLTVWSRAIDTFLGFLLDELPPVYRMRFHAPPTLETDGMDKKFELVPSSAVGIREVDLGGNATSHHLTNQMRMSHRHHAQV